MYQVLISGLCLYTAYRIIQVYTIHSKSFFLFGVGADFLFRDTRKTLFISHVHETIQHPEYNIIIIRSVCVF